MKRVRALRVPPNLSLRARPLERAKNLGRPGLF
jgi:hypothetical protein